MISQKALVLCALYLCSCSGGDTQSRTGTAGTSTANNRAGLDNAADDDSDENTTADEPVDVTGAYLTSDFIPDLPGKLDGDVSIGGHVEKNGLIVSLIGMQAVGKVINTTSNVVIKELVVDVDATKYHYQWNMKASEMPLAILSVDITDTAGKTVTLTKKMTDMTGSSLPSITSDKVFDFNSLSDVPTGLTASSYCDANGPTGVVKKTIDALPVTIATLSQGETIALSKTDHCFHPVEEFVGTVEKSLLAVSEKNSEYIGSGLANGGTAACLFIFVENISATAPEPTKMFIIKDNKGGLEVDLRKTAADFRCP